MIPDDGNKYNWSKGNGYLWGYVQTLAVHPGLRKKRITPDTCLKFCIVLKKKVIDSRESITW